MPLPAKAWTSGTELPIAGMCNWGPIRKVGQSGVPGPKEALIHPTWPPGQPAADPHGSGHKGACLGGDTHLSRLHPPGCWAKDPAVRIGLGHKAARPRWGVGEACLATSDMGGPQAVCV